MWQLISSKCSCGCPFQGHLMWSTSNRAIGKCSQHRYSIAAVQFAADYMAKLVGNGGGIRWQTMLSKLSSYWRNSRHRSIIEDFSLAFHHTLFYGACLPLFFLFRN
ncbi:hypothetical protein Leryth_021645 [Lithospermum erythrorhizon]|nr:hypothetical protein Leryth_021645 [Lithospermum erythrorhizon]